MLRSTENTHISTWPSAGAVNGRSPAHGYHRPCSALPEVSNGRRKRTQGPGTPRTTSCWPGAASTDTPVAEWLLLVAQLLEATNGLLPPELSAALEEVSAFRLPQRPPGAGEAKVQEAFGPLSGPLSVLFLTSHASLGGTR